MVLLEAPSLPSPEFKTGMKSGFELHEVQRGADLYRHGDTAGALVEYGSAVNVSPDNAYIRRTRALLLGELGRYEEAIADFDYLLTTQPRSADVLLLKGMALYQMARFQDSLEACEEGTRLSPSNAALQAMRGYALDALGRQQEALVAFGESLAIQNNPHVEKARKVILDASLMSLVDSGFATWSGGKPKGSEHPVKLSPGPSITELVHEGRR
jgi:tetratricopeptide (TPR) repeat protein